MNLFDVSTYVLVLVLSLFCVIFFWARRSALAVAATLGFVIRATLGLILESSVKYFLVVDNVAYEANAWSFAKGLGGALAADPLRSGWSDYSFYEKILGIVFYIFGRHPYVGILLNSLVAALTIVLVGRIARLFCRDRSVAITASLLAVYPSFVVWSSANIRDPMYVFFSALFVASGLVAFSPAVNRSRLVRILGLVGLALSLALVMRFREYIGGVFLAALFAAVGGPPLIWGWHKRSIGPAYALVIIPTFVIILGLYLADWVSPESIQELLSYVQRTRTSMALRGTDEYAWSSFVLDYSFSSVTSLILFMPVGFLHFFFAPFPWAIRGTLQLMALPEVLCIYAFVIPTWLGVRSSFKKRRFETGYILFFAFTIAASQALVVSNMGTIFRHRTLVLLLLSIFTGQGLSELWQKRFKAY